MKEEKKHTIELNEIKGQLYQIKILLIIIIALCILGFYGQSRGMWDDIAGIMTKIFEIIMIISVILLPILLIGWIAAINSLLQMNANIEKAESEQQQEN